MTLTQRAFHILIAKIGKTSAMYDARPNAMYSVRWTLAECRAADKARYKALQPLYETYDRLIRRARINNERRKK